MPLSTAEKTALQADAQAMVDAIAALTVDPDVNPLQAELDAAKLQIAELTTQVNDLTAANANLTAKVAQINADLDALDQADAAEDAARAKVRNDAK